MSSPHVGPKINIQKSTVFLCISNEKLEEKILFRKIGGKNTQKGETQINILKSCEKSV